MNDKLKDAAKDIQKMCIKHGVFIEPFEDGKVILRHEAVDGTKRLVVRLGAI